MKYLFFLAMTIWTAYRAYLIWQNIKNNPIYSFFTDKNDKNKNVDYEDIPEKK